MIRPNASEQGVREGVGVASGPGSQASPEAASASSPTVSIPNAAELDARLAEPDFQRSQTALLLATDLGYQLRSMRIIRGLTVDELAAMSEVSPRIIRIIERGEYLGGLRELAYIAYGLDVAISVKLVERRPLNERSDYVPSFTEEDAASGIEGEAGDAEERLHPEGESPAPKGDAQ